MKRSLKIIIPAITAIAAIVIAFVLIAFSPAQPAVDNIPDTAAMLSTAQKYLLEANYEQAIAEFEKTLEIDPKNIDAYLGIAAAYEALGDREKAIEWLEKGYNLTFDSRIKDMLDRLIIPQETETEAVTSAPEETQPETEPAVQLAVVPDLSGLSTGEAVSLCEQAGINYKILDGESDTVELGYIISQLIPAGAEVGKDTVLSFVVCTKNTKTPAETSASSVTAFTSAETSVTPVTVITVSETNAALTQTAETAVTEKITETEAGNITAESSAVTAAKSETTEKTTSGTVSSKAKETESSPPEKAPETEEEKWRRKTEEIISLFTDPVEENGEPNSVKYFYQNGYTMWEPATKPMCVIKAEYDKNGKLSKEYIAEGYVQIGDSYITPGSLHVNDKINNSSRSFNLSSGAEVSLKGPWSTSVYSHIPYAETCEIGSSSIKFKTEYETSINVSVNKNEIKSIAENISGIAYEYKKDKSGKWVCDVQYTGTYYPFCSGLPEGITDSWFDIPDASVHFNNTTDYDNYNHKWQEQQWEAQQQAIENGMFPDF